MKKKDNCRVRSGGKAPDQPLPAHQVRQTEENMGDNKDNLDFGFMDDAVKNVQDRVERAINSQDFKDMSGSVTRMVNETLRQYQQYKKNHPQTGGQRASDRVNSRQASSGTRASGTEVPFGMAAPFESEAHPELYARVGGERIKDILLIVFGAILAGTMGVSLLTVQVVSMVIGYAWPGSTLTALIAAAAGVGMLYKGISGLGCLSRFKKYVNTLGNRTYCEFDRLARSVGRPVKFVRKDVEKMIKKGWFIEGKTDKQETCLITSRETYLQYEETQKSLEQQRLRAEQEAKERAKTPREVQEVLDKGEEYLKKIRASNDAIPGEEISAKIDKMEKIVDQIFQRAEEHPEVIPDLKRLMDYYLPTTIRLLDAYEEMDGQPVQGETIQSSKKEIEATIDTLNEAFAKLLDSIFQDTAWDVSSDISVLHTMLAQEGLTDSDFKK